MKPLFSQADRDRLSNAIRQAESRTSGELVTVIARASDNYYYIPALWAAVFALLVPAVILLVGTSMAASTLFALQVAVFFTLALLFRIPALKFALVPKYIRYQRASRVAREQFFTQGLQNTGDRTGILIFVSVAEHYVEVIADKGINDAVPDGTWEQVVNDFIIRVKAGQHMEGFIAAIQECGDILAEHFPADEKNPNELPDHLVEIQ